MYLYMFVGRTSGPNWIKLPGSVAVWVQMIADKLGLMGGAYQ